MYSEISLSKFLSRYCRLSGLELTKVTHEEVKQLFPQFRRSSFKEINEHPELVMSGRVVLVNDGRKTIPYYSVIEEDAFDYDEIMREEYNDEIVIDDNHYDMSKQTIYKLRLLLRHKYNSLRNQNAARRELNNRGIVLSKKYNRCKMKREMENL